ncbi:MAG: ribonuclease HII [Bacteroidales bacterium]|nr:ribonuclease HII [Bacteroidales bacterium]
MLKPYLKKGRREAGCDEAGRGCLAGPVYAAAVILPLDIEERIAKGVSELAALNDSKQLSEKRRYELRPIIEREALAWAVGMCDNHEIDHLNILWASIEAMHRAVRGLSMAKADGKECVLRGGEVLQPEFLLIDGNRFSPFEKIPYQTIVKGDGTMMSIAAASILAKTYRDDVMNALHEEFPNYAWNVNKGYPTKAHREAIAHFGVTPYHRMSFRLLPEAKQLEIGWDEDEK